MINIGLIGLGNVGKSVCEIFSKNISVIENKIGTKIRIKKVCDIDKKKKKIAESINAEFTKRWKEIVFDPEIDVVVELIGGIEPAKTIIIEAIKNKKQIVTANKMLLATYWNEIFSLAEKKKVLVYFEASVAGAVPVIQALNEGMAANKINSMIGILNATTNYILTKMKEGMNFKEALRETQKAGFAEANPFLDIEGIDSAHKLSILSSIALCSWVKVEKIYVEGIRNIKREDIEHAKKLGFIIKLLAIYKNSKNEIDTRVHPALIKIGNPLADVDNEYNAIIINGDVSEDLMFYGKGAGGIPAASAVVSDIIYLARHVNNKTTERMKYVTYKKRRLKFLHINNIKTKYYLRFITEDKPGVLAKISGILGKNKVSIASCFQELLNNKANIIMLIHEAKEKQVRNALKKINSLSITRTKAIMIRVEE